jgi:hypothetical protein
MQGVFTVVVAGGPRVSDLLHGWGGSVIGTGPTVVIGGIATVLLTVGAVLLLPAFWRYRFTPDPVAPGGAVAPAP